MFFLPFATLRSLGISMVLRPRLFPVESLVLLDAINVLE